MSTLLGPAVVLVAIIGTLRIALGQPDQPATAKNKSERTPSPQGAHSYRPTPVATARAPMPAGFQWMEAAPAPRLRSGFALVVILAVVGALLAVAVAGVVVAIAVAFRAALA